ncbi:SusC/RagA family TonB-linked outer membrane protein [Chitinophaga filiformis]|uniref:TonB-linked outer membrane protein, SusC/RagA family n=1 Tax=Chitinophaga filiformis TaxID=104663 RepID=A0A1G7SYC1_CHIFI|nr:SusC/RagA family TonB-linked outer membrane protein [Chitinophaga filiformis]SDG27764.1 TonB-linked outer membrane protein, SusC/RagA family [Chitinophaga filiformis]
MLAVCLQISANGFSQTVTFSGRDVPLGKVFSAIKEQTGYVLFYDYSVLDGSRPVTLSVKNDPIDHFLTRILKGQLLDYKIIRKTIFIKKTDPPAGPKELQPEEADIPVANPPITGRITNENGEPLVGATMKVKGGKAVAVTDANGKFSIDANVGDLLVISYVGFASREIMINTAEIGRVSLSPSDSRLDEIQIIAYGVSTKRFVTGSATTIKSADIEKQPVTNVLTALQGRMPGVFITSANGIPGSAVTMQIRGNNSISALSNPLYIVDGIPIPATSISNVSNTASGSVSPFNSINPMDIESITVLKDAEATAIYGSRGSNGVVLITTKKGKAGKTKLDVNAYSGASVATRIPEFMNTQQYLTIRKKAFAADNITPTISNAQDLLLWDQNAYTNFPKLILGNTSPLTNVQATVSGGDENTRFLLGGGYHHEGSIIFGDNHDNRVSGHLNLDHNSTDKRLNINTSVTYSNDNIKTLAADPYLSIFAPPNFPHYDTTGNLYWIKGNTTPPLTNPYSYLLKVGRTSTDNFIANTSIRYAVLPGLNAKVNVGYTKMSMAQQSTAPTTAFNPTSTSSTKSSATFGNSSTQSYIIEPQLDYTKKISKGVLNVLAGSTMQSSSSKTNSITGINFTSDDLIESISAATAITNKTLTNTQYKYISGFGRANFRWKDRYILNATFRRDGSSRFGPGRQFGDFWSVSGGWIFSEENIVKRTLPVLSFGKLRSSYGVTGNDQILDYRYLETYTSNSLPYNGNLGLYSNNIANPDYGWETNKKLEVAMDLGFLKDRILLTSAFYRSRSNNQLVQTSLPTQSGFSYYQANLPALVQNTSWEFELSTTNINSKRFHWQTNFNITFPKNTLLAFPGLASSPYALYYVVGQPLDLFRGYHYTGISATTGVAQFEDVNKDGSITSSGDYINIGSRYPKYYGGLSNTISYKNFSLDIFLQFSKQNGYNAIKAYYYPVGYKVNLPAYLAQDYWEPGHTNASRSALTTTTSSDAGYAYIYQLPMSSAAYSDASYIRVKNLSFSYSLPKKIIEKMRAQSLRVYVQGQNLFTFTHYKGLDPEVQNATPVLKTLTGGIQLTL